MGKHGCVALAMVGSVVSGACGFPRPAPFNDRDDAGVAASSDSGGSASDGMTAPVCAANQALRCDGDSLVSCNADGSAELPTNCLLGCNAAGPTCKNVDPSNALAQYLDQASAEPDIDLGTNATINVVDGTIIVDGQSVVVRNALVAQISAPPILVLMVHSLTANSVMVKAPSTGGNALAIVSDGDIQLRGTFNASANGSLPGPGAFNTAGCKGGDAVVQQTGEAGGAGGGGFGLPGGVGGSGTNLSSTAAGGTSGTATGNAQLVPLRGGCSSGKILSGAPGGGGGAIQLVSRTKISIAGVVAANGGNGYGGGSGGGVLLEAPVVEVFGTVVTNGASGDSGCLLAGFGQDGRLDPMPAAGGTGCSFGGNGGQGGAGGAPAGNGVSLNSSGSSDQRARGGHGGGGVGRIRINTRPGGFHRAGLFSPEPSTGDIGVR